MILLSSTRPGVTRAEEGPDGRWSVTRHLASWHVAALAAGPDGSVWAGTSDAAVFRSPDRGASWDLRTEPGGMEAEGLRALAVSPHDPLHLIAGTKPAGVFLSRDGGSSWQEALGFGEARRWYWASPAEPPDLRPYVSAVAFSPVDPDVIVVGVEAGAVVRSSDGGRSWSGHRRRADRDCHALAFHATDGEWVYQAGGGGPAVSRDGGATWRHAARGLAGRYAVACAADPGRPEVWYVSAAPTVVWPAFWRTPTAHWDGRAHGSIYRSVGGAGWERLGGGLPQPLDHMAYGLATDPRQPGAVYAGLSNGRVWCSTDFGDSWQPLPVELGGVRRAFLLA